jgi:hypothetical protein
MNKRRYLLITFLMILISGLFPSDLSVGSGFVMDNSFSESYSPGATFSGAGGYSHIFTEAHSLFFDAGGIVTWYPGLERYALDGIARFEISSRYETILHLLSLSSQLSYLSSSEDLNLITSLGQKIMLYPGAVTFSIDPVIIHQYDGSSSFSGALSLGIFPPGSGRALFAPYIDTNFSIGSEDLKYSISAYIDLTLAMHYRLNVDLQTGFIYNLDPGSEYNPALTYRELFWEGDFLMLLGRRVSMGLSLPGSLRFSDFENASDRSLFLAPSLDIFFSINRRFSLHSSVGLDLVFSDSLYYERGPDHLSLEAEYSIF